MPKTGDNGRTHNLPILAAVFSAAAFMIALVWGDAKLFGDGSAFAFSHGILEVFVIVLSLMVFAIIWNTERYESTGIQGAGALFLAVALLDMAHLFSYGKAPSFLTPDVPAKAVNFYIVARLIAAVAILLIPLSAFPRTRRILARSRQDWLILSLTIATVVYGIGFIVPGTGNVVHGGTLSGFRIGAGALVVAVHLGTIALFAAMNLWKESDGQWLLGATWVMGLSEIALSLHYMRGGDGLNVVGHGLQIVAYGMVYRAVFLSRIERPYRLLAATRAEARDSESTLRALINANQKDGIAFIGAGGDLRISNFFPSPEMKAVAREAAQSRRPHQAEGEWMGRWYDQHFYPTLGSDGELLGVAVYARDVTERREREIELRKVTAAIEQSPVSVMITDTKGTIEYVNPTFCKITGYAAADMIGQNPRILKSEYNAEETYADLWRTISAGHIWEGELCNKKKNGEPYWELEIISPIKDEDGTITHFLAVKENITRRKEAEAKLVYQGSHDQLTGLPNRILAMDRLGLAIAAARSVSKTAVVMYINIDGLGRVNSSLGHAAGDAVLTEVAARLKAAVGPVDTVARMEGDGFLVMVSNIDTSAIAEATARRILEKCREAIRIDGREEVFVTARVGMTVFPVDGDDPYILVRNAHAALARAKERGGDTYRFFTVGMDKEASARLKVESALRHALEKDEFRVFYQPLVEARSGAIVGAEALIRWKNEELGFVPPDKFIPLAEASELILPIGDWVLRTACRDAAHWRKLAGSRFFVAVNFSPRQFADTDLVDKMQGILAETGLPATCLEVEVTERLLLGESAEAEAMLHAIKDLGAQLSLDDFGTGYSAMSYLTRYSFETLKVDRSFIKNILKSPKDMTLLRAILNMAHTLKMKVIAEGVETGDCADVLRDLGCEILQGYHFARPMPAEEFVKLLESKNVRLPVPH